ncbi:MAG: DMT family transporter [Steroidobacterales bacterium]
MNTSITSARQHHHGRDRLQGIMLMIAAVFVFAIMDASLKRLSSRYGMFQVSCMRCFSSLLFLMVPVIWRGSYGQLRMRSPLLHLVRAVVGVGMLASFVYAVNRLSLGETYAVCLCAPLLMTALSVPFHGERVPGRRWAAIALGLAGVMLILRPSGAGFRSLAAVLAAFLCALCYALGALTVRTMSRTNSSTGLVFWFLVLAGGSTAIMSINDWQSIPSSDWGWLAVVGLSGALGQYWITDAFRLAPPSVVGPFEYTSILWAFAIDWVFWSAKPTTGLVTGATVVIASGVFVILDERRLAQLALNPASPPP